MPEKKKSVTFMMRPALKKEVDLLAAEQGNRPCDTLDLLVGLGLDKLAEIGQYAPPDGRSARLAETGARYEVKASNKAITASEGMSNCHDQNCHDCKYLGSHPAIETWLGIGDIDYWCENENVIDVPKTLENDMMDIYPDWCGGFEAFEATAANEVKG